MDQHAVTTQTTACTQLLASVVGLAISDACTKPTRKMFRRKDGPPRYVTEPTDAAIDALVFLMGNAEHVINVLGMDGDRFKQKLVDQMFERGDASDEPNYFTSHIEEKKRYNFRHNYTWLLNNPQRRLTLNLEDDDETDRHAELDDGVRRTSPGLDSGEQLQTDGPEAVRRAEETLYSVSSGEEPLYIGRSLHSNQGESHGCDGDMEQRAQQLG